MLLWFYLSHFFLPVIQWFSRVAGRWTSAQTMEAKAATFLLFFIQNLILRKQNSFKTTEGNAQKGSQQDFRQSKKETNQPSSSDDQSVLACLCEERLFRSLSGSAKICRRLTPSGGLTDPQLLATNPKNKKISLKEKQQLHDIRFPYSYSVLPK